MSQPMSGAHVKLSVAVLATLVTASLAFTLFAVSDRSTFPAAKPTATAVRLTATTVRTATAIRTPTPSPSPTSAPTRSGTRTELDAGTTAIRACLARPDAQPVYARAFPDGRYPDVGYVQYELGKFYITVYSQTHRVESIGPGGDLPRAGAAPTPDLTPRYTPAQLEAMARAFIARCAGGPNLDLLTPNHTHSPTTTEGVAFFFRWEDRTRLLVSGVPPLVQVGFTRGGELLNYSNWLELAPTAKLVTPPPTMNPGVILTPVCWSARSPMPTATPTPAAYWQRVPSTGPFVVFPCGAPVDRQSWLTYTGTGITNTNRAILDLYPLVKPPTLTLMIPPGWRITQLAEHYAGSGNRTPLDFVLSKRDGALIEPRGEGPSAGDISIHFALFLDAGSPDDYHGTEPLGHGGLGTVIEHGSFNGYRAMFARAGDLRTSFQRDVLFEAAPVVLIDIDIYFFAAGASPAYVQQTLEELDGILASVRSVR